MQPFAHNDGVDRYLLLLIGLRNRIPREIAPEKKSQKPATFSAFTFTFTPIIVRPAFYQLQQSIRPRRITPVYNGASLAFYLSQIFISLADFRQTVAFRKCQYQQSNANFLVSSQQDRLTRLYDKQNCRLSTCT